MSLRERRDELEKLARNKPEIVEPRYGTCVSMEVSNEGVWMAPVMGTVASGLLFCESHAKVEISFVQGDVREVVELEVEPKTPLNFGSKKVNLMAGGMVKMKVSGSARPVIGSFVFLVT